MIFSAFNTKKYTEPKDDIAAGAVIRWGEHFFFTGSNLEIEAVESAKINIEIRNHKMLQKDSLIGSYEFDLTYIYYQKKHSLIHQWVALCNPETGNFQNIRGHIKIGICIQGEKDEDIDLTTRETTVTKDTEILLPPQISLKPYQLIISLIKAEGLPQLDDYGTIDAYCDITFGGVHTKSSVIKADKLRYSVNWYEEIYIPVLMPNVSSKLIIDLMDEDPLRPDNAGSLIFDFKKIEKNEYANFFWSNLYGAPIGYKNNHAQIMNRVPEAASAWHGRILLKIEFKETKKAVLDRKKIEDEEIIDYIQQNFEENEDYEIRCQVYSAVALSDHYSEYSIAVCWAGAEQETTIVRMENKKCTWYERLNKKIMKIHKGFDNFCDIFIYLRAHKLNVCYTRLNSKDFRDIMAEPKWIALTPDKAIGKIANEWEGGHLLIRIYTGKYTGDEDDRIGKWHLPPHKVSPKRLKKAKLLFNLYQCRELPSADSDGQSDPYVELYCDGQTVISPVIDNTLNPMWYKILALDLEIASMIDCPPIIVYVKDKDFASDDLIGVCNYSISEAKVDEQTPAYPEWKELNLGKISGGKILASMNLYMDSENVPCYDIVPNCLEVTVEISCLGLRDLSPAVGWLPVNKAFIKFDMNSLQIPKEETFSMRNVQTQPGEGGPNPTINAVVRFNFLMPEDKIFSPALTCIVYDYLFRGLSQPQIGIFNINLGDVYHSILPTSLQFENSDVSLEENVLYTDTDRHSKRSQSIKYPDADRKLKTSQSIKYTETNRRLNASQSMKCAETDRLLKVNQSIKNMESPTKEGARKGDFVIYPVYFTDIDGKVKEHDKPDSSYMIIGYNRTSEDHIMHYRYLLDTELENTEYIDKSPFQIIKIKRGQERGEDSWVSGIFSNSKAEQDNPVNTVKEVGLFKGLIRVTKTSILEEKDEKVKRIKTMRNTLNIDEGVDDEDEDFTDIRKLLLQKTQIVVRIYILLCQNLAQKDLKSHSDPYIKIKLAGNVINDAKNYQTDEPNPRFFKHFDIVATLPGACRLKIQLWDQDDFVSDDKIGETVIDLEDRYFSNKWRRIIEKPIERRQLMHKSTKLSQGSILLWLEMHPLNAVPEPLDISEKPPAEFEARLIIWQTSGVADHDVEGTSDLYIRAFVNENKPKETDTHYRCQNGKGQFNWRLLFPVKLPCENCIISLQIWDRDVFSPSDFIADASFSFNELAKECFEREKRLKMLGGKDSMFSMWKKNDSERFWIECFIRKEDGTMKIGGKIEISFELVPKADSLACPVGEGRSEPNIDPKLPDPTGRFQWSLNPFKLINQTCGPGFRAKICCCICCIFCVYIAIMVAPSLIGTLIGRI